MKEAMKSSLGMGDGTIDKELAMQAQEPVFRSPAPMFKKLDSVDAYNPSPRETESASLAELVS